MAMLQHEKPLTLELLNRASQAWVELDYHRARHEELGTTPLHRYVNAPSLARECPSIEALRAAFRIQVTRKQRRSDGTVSLEARRFEVLCPLGLEPRRCSAHLPARTADPVRKPLLRPIASLSTGPGQLASRHARQTASPHTLRSQP